MPPDQDTLPDWARPAAQEETVPSWAQEPVSRDIEKPTALGAAARGAVRGILPAAGSMVGFGAGAEAGAALGALGGPLAPFTVPAGAVIGGLGGAYAGGYGAGKAQEAVLEHVPEWAREAIGQSEAQRQADIAAHRYAAMVGELAPNLAGMSPRAAARVVEEGAGAVQRIMAHPATGRVAGAGIMGGQEAASEAVQGEPIDPGKVAIAAGAGALMQRPTRLGERLTEVGAAPVRAVTPTPAPAAVAATPAGLPPIGEPVGFSWDKDTPPSRIIPVEYLDGGRSVRAQTEDGGQALITTADLMRGLTAPPLPERPQLEGVPATLEDITKNAPPLEDLEASSMAGAQARAAGQRPERFAQMQREAQAGAALLPATVNPLLDAAARNERYGEAAIKSGNIRDAENYFAVAQMFRQRAQEAGGGPPVSEPITSEDAARAAAMRGAPPGPTDTSIMGQRVPLGPQGEPITAEDAARAAAARGEAAQPEILGQRTPLGPRAETITPEDELRAAQLRSANLEQEVRQAVGFLTQEAVSRGTPRTQFTPEEIADAVTRRRATAAEQAPAQPAQGVLLAPEARPGSVEAPAAPPQPAATTEEQVQAILSSYVKEGDPGSNHLESVNALRKLGFSVTQAREILSSALSERGERPNQFRNIIAEQREAARVGRTWSPEGGIGGPAIEGEPTKIAGELLPPQPVPAPETPLTETVPKQPQRLLSWLRMNGGVQDPGGDVSQIIGGTRGRPGLINRAGMTLDDAALKAWEDGYFPTAQRPSVNDLLDAIDQDHRGTQRRYSGIDSPAVAAYEGALARNSEVDRLAGQYEIDPTGMSREQFWDRIADRLSQDGQAREIADQTAANEAAFAEAEARTQEWFATRGEAWEPDVVYEGVPRTLEDMERDAGQGGDRRWDAARASGEGAGGVEQPRPPGGAEGAIQEGAGPRGGGVGPEAGAEAAREPVTERTEQGEQIVLPGAEQSPEQQAALRAAEQRTAQERELAERNRTMLRTGRPQEAPGGMFAEPPPPELFEGAPKGWEAADTSTEISLAPGYDEQKDTLAEYQAFHAQGGYPDTPLGAHQSARDYVLAMGKATGFEYFAAHDGTRIIAAGTSGRPNAVALNVPDMADPNANIVGHHNHPSSTSLSGPDISVLSYPGLKWVVAHSFDGEMFAAQLTPEARAAATYDVRMKVGLKQAFQAADGVVRPSLTMQIIGGKLTWEDGDRFLADLNSRAMDAAGIIDYVGTRGDMPLKEMVRDSILQRAVAKVADMASQYGIPRISADAAANRLNRSTIGVRPDVALARISGEPGGYPGGAGGAEAGRGGVSEAGPGEEAVVGTRPELAAPEPLRAERTELPAEGRDYVDALTEEIGRETGGRGPGTYARDMLKRMPPGEARTPFRFNAVNSDITLPFTVEQNDWRFHQKAAAERALRDEHMARIHAFQDMLPTYLGLSPEDRATFNKAAELYRLQGVAPIFDGRQLVIENTGQRARFTQPGERVYLDRPELVQAAKEVHDAYQKAWSDLIEGTARKFGWQGDPTSEAIRTGAGESGVAPYPRKQWERAAQLIAGLESQRQAGYMAPLMRFGDYYLAVKPKNPGVAGWDGTGFPPVSEFRLVDSHTPWEKMIGKTEPEGTTPGAVQPHVAELRQQYPPSDYTIDEGYLFSKPQAFRDLNIPAVEKLMLLVGRDVKAQIREQAKTSGDPEALKQVESKTQDFYNQMIDTVLKSMYDDLKAGFKNRAQATPGYSEDFPRALSAYLNWNASHVAELMHRDAVDRANAVVYGSADPVTGHVGGHPDPKVQAYARALDRRPETPYTALDTGLALARKATFLWYLGMNVASTAKIALHGPMLGINVLSTGLGARGWPAAAGAYYRALANIAKTTRLDLENGFTNDPIAAAKNPEQRSMLQRLEAIGVLHPAGADELAALRKSGEDALEPQAKFNRRVLELMASNIRWADRATRGAVAMATHELMSNPQYRDRMVNTWGKYNEVVRGFGPDPTPEQMARFMVDRTTGVWGPAGRSPAMQARWGAQLLQFRAYEAVYLSNLLNMATRMGPEGKVTAAMMMLSMGSMAGAFGLPFAQDAVAGAEWIYKELTQIAPDLMTDITDTTNRVMSAVGMDKLATEAVLHGMGRSVLGIDLGAGVGFGELLTGHASPTDIFGPAFSLAVGMPSRVNERRMTGQTPLEIAAEAMPNAVKNALRGTLIYPEQGMRAAATGKPTLTAQEISGTGLTATALGFQTAEGARRREALERDFKAGEQDKEEKALFDHRINVLMSRSSIARQQGNTAEADALDQQIRDEVTEHHGISRQAVRRGVLEQTAPETAAARRVPKAVRPGLAESPYVPATP